jgi:23S rRNA pseudouridine955/2504/2580 synthase
MIKKFIITDEFVNSRLDRWFRRKIFDIPQSLLEKSIRKGYIKVNDKKRSVHINLNLMIK